MPFTRRISPDGFKRVVLWQPSSGFVTDLDFRKILRGGSPAITKAYFNAGDGSDYEETIDRIFEIETPDNDLLEALRVMKAVGCPVCLAGMSFNKAVLWLDPSNMVLTPSRPGFGGFAGEVIRIKNDNFYTPIFDVRNLVQGFPWHCASVEPILDEVGDPTGTYRLHYAYPDADWGWVVTGGDGVTQYVDASGQLVQGENAVLEFTFPCAGAVIQLQSEGLIEVLDFAGDVIVSTQSQPITLPYFTWALRVTVQFEDYQPKLELLDPGPMLPPRIGVCVVCEDPGDIEPPWTIVTAITEPQNILPPRDGVVTEPQNILPLEFALSVVTEPQNIQPQQNQTPITEPQNILPLEV